MKDLFVTKDVAYGVVGTVAGTWEADSLPVGSIVFFNPDGSNASSGTTGAISAAFTSGAEYFTINGMKTNGNKQSIKIDRRNFEYTKKVYVAPVKAVKFLGSNILTSATSEKGNLNLPSSISVGDVVGCTVVDKSKAPYDTTAPKTYDFRVLAGDLITGTGVKNIIAKLVVKINADTNRVVDAVAVTDGTNNDGIKFTARTAGVDFGIARIDGVLYNSDICEYNIVNNVYTASVTNAVANNTGNGTYAQLVAIEADALTRDGNTHTQLLTNHMWSDTSNLVSSNTYVTYYCTFTPVQDSAIDRDTNYKQLIMIAAPTGSTAILADLDTMLAAVNNYSN